MQVPIVSGIYADSASDLRTSYPRNYWPVPKVNGVSEGYLKPGDGLVQWGPGGPGKGRGGINWKGALYRVMGSKLVRVNTGGGLTLLGDVGDGGTVTMDYGADRLAIWSAGRLFYWDGRVLSEVIDPDLGTVIDGKWIAGYYVSTDGTFIITTDIADPMSVNPLHYGSAESDPDVVMAIDELRDEMYAFGRYTIQAFQNTGDSNPANVAGTFPFTNIEGAEVPKGAIGTHAYCSIGDTFVFLGSGRNEAPGVYLMLPGDTQKLSTREIDRILEGYTDIELSLVVCETIVVRNHQFVLFHLPDQCIAYDTIGSKAVGKDLWHTRDSGTLLERTTYRGRNFIWCYGQWCCEDPTTNLLATTTDTSSHHFGQAVGWEFGTQMAYVDGNDAIVNELELAALPGRVALGVDATVWTSHSFDGETWSQEHPVSAGKQGGRAKRIAWRRQGRVRNMRMQRFRGTSDAHMPILRLEAQLEPLFTRTGRGQ